MQNGPDRINELDWVRVLVVFAVFLHHVGMPFNGDDWLIMNRESSSLLDDIMVYFEQFRLPSLFMVAGVGASLLLAKRSAGRFAIEKAKRLLIPLTIGVLLIVPPQLYFRNPEEFTSLWSAYPELALELETQHLWFIEYLFVFSLLAIPFHRLLRSDRGRMAINALSYVLIHPVGLISLGLVLAALRIGLKIYFPSDDLGLDNLSSSIFYLFFFMAGLLLAQRVELWRTLGDNLATIGGAFAAISIVFYVYYLFDFSSFASIETLWSIWWALASLVAWTGALTLIGGAQRYLKASPGWLQKSNMLIYPFYILHQTVIVVLAFHIVEWSAGIAVKMSVLLLSSFAITAAICAFLIYPFNVARFMFGLKPKPARTAG
ncbi:acyltransferase family protein [Parerythrobacter lacustris]|uniref:Acyltransferase family protein n=1 Tax=Parerythrobacter lacustris TaxID=2969984 RepID=A0ABT1XMR5_9SPHN|nr:acyltransferase family protein [Parerythrobacter lacustris]MCR2832872.1 acyltransferase family protein [Parerythrobacter lacustris]